MWKKLSSRVVFNHPRLMIVEDQIELPNGHKTDYLKFDYKGNVVAIIAKNKKNQILIQKEYSYPPNEYIFYLPGGLVAKDENLKVGANRELMEEAGFKASRLTLLGNFYSHDRRSNIKAYIYLAEDLEEKSLPKDLEEDIESFWLTEEEVDQLIKDNQIQNSLALAAWCLYKSKK